MVYIPPDADTGIALTELHDVLSAFQNKDPNTALIVVGDFNKANLRQVMPNFYQHVMCPTRGARTLNHCYTPYKQDYKAVSQPAFGKSDHSAIFLIPQYKQHIRREEVATREVKCWSAQSEAMLQDALEDVDWDMFRASANDVNEFMDVAVSFVSMLAEEIIPTVRIKDVPKSEAVGGQIDPRCSERQDRHIQLGSCNWRNERLQSGVIRRPARSERRQTPVSGASEVSLPSGGHTEYVAGFAHHYGLQNQGH